MFYNPKFFINIEQQKSSGENSFFSKSNIAKKKKKNIAVQPHNLQTILPSYKTLDPAAFGNGLDVYCSRLPFTVPVI